MKLASSKIVSLRRQTITVLMLVLALGTYLAIVVPAQRSFLIKRSFRVLADMGRQINVALENLGSSLANATKTTPPNLESLETEGSAFLTAIKDHRPGTDSSWESVSNHVASMLRLVPNLVLDSIATNKVDSATGRAQASGLSLVTNGVGKASSLQFEYRNGSPDVHLVAHSDLTRLVEPIVNRAEFDEVLLVDTSGVVLVQIGTSALQVTRLPELPDRSFQTNLVDYAGAEYQLFSQPLLVIPAGIRGASATGATEWRLCGLVRGDRFAAETRSVKYTILILFTFLALLLVLSWPFLNVWSLGLKGGLRPGEVLALLASTVAMNAFLGLMLLDLFSLSRINGCSDRQLEAFASEIDQHLRAELRQVARQMMVLNERFLTNPVNQMNLFRQTNLVDIARTNEVPYPYFGMATWIANQNGEQLVKWTVKEQNTPLVNVGRRAYFQIVSEGRAWSLGLGDHPNSPTVRFCLDSIFSYNTGENLATFSMRPTNDWRVVSTIDCRLLSLVNPVVPAGFGFCVVDQAGNVLFHSDPRRNLRENFFEECDQDANLRVAVLGRHADQFDTRYANRDYRLFVMPLHELPWSLVTFRDGIVLGTAHVETVSVAALLFLLYFVVLAALGFLIYLLVHRMGAHRCLAWYWPSPHRGNVYGLLTTLNLALTAVCVILLVLPVDGKWRLLAALVLPPLAMVLCIRGLSRGRVGSRRLRWLARKLRFRLSNRVGYVLTHGTLLLLVASLPMILFFQTAFDTETQLLIKHAQLRLAQDLETRAQRIWGETYGITGPERTRGRPLALPSRTDYFSRRLTNDWDLYTRFFFDTQARLSEGEPRTNSAVTSFVDRSLLKLRPHYNEQDVFTRSTAGPGATDGAWFWTNQLAKADGSNATPSLEFVKDPVHVPGRRAAQQLRIDSAAPDWGQSSWLWGLTFLALLAVPFYVVYVVADKLLLLSEGPAAAGGSLVSQDRRNSHASLGPGKYLLLGPSRSGKSRQLLPERFAGLKAGKVLRVNLRDTSDYKWLEPEQTDELLRETSQAIVVDSLEYRHDEPEFTQKKLRFLRQLILDEPRTVVMVSNIHPLHFRLAGGDTEKGQADITAAANAAAWVEVIACFRKLYVPGRWSPALFSSPERQGASGGARAMHRSIWWTCSPAEQELLVQVAQGRLVNSYQPELAALRERGLLRRDPALQLADEPFRRFVLTAYRPSAVVRETPDEAPGLLQSLKGPVITVLIITAGFFFITQKEMWNSAVVLITTFVTGIGAFAKGFEMFQTTRLKRTPPE